MMRLLRSLKEKMHHLKRWTTLEAFIEETFEDIEVEVHDGKQPLYSYILAVE